MQITVPRVHARRRREASAMDRDDGNGAIGGEGVPEGYYSRRDATRAERAREMVERVREMPDVMRKANDQFVEFVREKPLVALGAACAIGYVLGRSLRRVF
jgi:hypothetical protein